MYGGVLTWGRSAPKHVQESSKEKYVGTCRNLLIVIGTDCSLSMEEDKQIETGRCEKQTKNESDNKLCVLMGRGHRQRIRLSEGFTGCIAKSSYRAVIWHSITDSYFTEGL